jgi:hypothetical protein
LDKSRDSELQNGSAHTTFEEQWESNSALKVDQLLRNMPMNVLVSGEEHFFVYTHSASFTPFSLTHLVSFSEGTLDTLSNDLFNSG